MDEGWTRYVFDNFNVPYTSLRDAEVRAGDLRAKYDVIVLPSMREREIVEGRAKNTAPPEFTGGVGEAGVAALRRFVEEGGTLVAWDDSTDFVIKRFELPVRNALEGLKTSDFYCPGSILRVEVDTGHALGRGLPPLSDVYFVNSAAFEVKDARRVARGRALRREEGGRAPLRLAPRPAAPRRQARARRGRTRQRPPPPHRLPPAAPRADLGHLPLRLQRARAVAVVSGRWSSVRVSGGLPRRG